VFSVGNGPPKLGYDDPSLSTDTDQLSGGGSYTSVTVVLAVGLSITLSVLVILLVITVVRRLRASSRSKNNAVDTPSSGVPAHVRGSVSSWGFASIRSKFSVTSDASASDQQLS